MISNKRKVISFVVTAILLVVMFFVAACTGSLKVSLADVYRGLFVEYSETVSIIYDLRFPRILIAILAGGATAVSGVMLQAVMKNPLADPGIIGVSSGASLVAVLVVVFFPAMYFFVPMFAFIGGIVAFGLVYALSYKDGLSPVRIILVGVALNAFFTGLMSAFNAGTGSQISSVTSIVSSNISMKTWDDFNMLAIYVAVGFVLSMLVSESCNLLALDDKTIRSLGVNVDKVRLLVSLVGVMLASVSTAIVGPISFLGLIVPHIARILVGSNHKVLLPYAMVLGALVLLVADTLGRVVVAPYEISSTVVMSVIGGPFFIALLRRQGDLYAKSR